MKRWEKKYYTFEEIEGDIGMPHFVVYKGDEKLGIIKPPDEQAYDELHGTLESGEEITGFGEGVLIPCNSVLMESQMIEEIKPPLCCSYCNEEKDFLMARPTAFKVEGHLLINTNHTGKQLWMCIECLSMELDSMGVNVEITVYE